MTLVPHRRLRELARSTLDHESVVWNRIVSGAASIADRRGAVPEVVAEARQRTDLPVHRRLFMIRWATDVGSPRPLPRGFRPAQHLRSDSALAAAREALEHRAATQDDPLSREQLIGLTDQGETDDLLGLIEGDLNRRLADRATRPKRGQGVNPEVLVPLVADVTSRLGRCGIRPFLMSGTLLGFMRDGTFLEHDHDVDLGILPETGLAEVADALTGSELELSVELDDFWLLGTHPSGLHIDFFRHEHRDDLFWHATRVHRWWNTPFALKRFDAEGHQWWIPDDPDRYLAENYGDWSDPVAFYEISFDTPNRRYQPTADAVRQLYVTCLRGLATGDRWMVESAARELRNGFGVDVTRYLADTALLHPTAGHDDARPASAPEARGDRTSTHAAPRHLPG